MKSNSSNHVLDNIWIGIPPTRKVNIFGKILAKVFQDTDAEHIVKEPCKNYGERGYHVSRSLKNYYRLDNPKEEVQHRFRMQLYALK